MGGSPGHRTLRLAHRGDHRHALENSLPALIAAVALPGCDGLEFDIRLARDRVPVLLHDETLQRVQRRLDRVDALTTDELGAFGIPTLSAVLASVPRAAFLDIELKVEGGPLVAEALRRGRGPSLENAVVSSFEPAALETIRALEPTWPCWLNARNLAPSTIALAGRLACRGISVEWHAIDEHGLGRARDAGLEVAAWTVARRAVFDRLAGLGVVAICVEGGALEG